VLPCRQADAEVHKLDFDWREVFLSAAFVLIRKQNMSRGYRQFFHPDSGLRDLHEPEQLPEFQDNRSGIPLDCRHHHSVEFQIA